MGKRYLEVMVLSLRAQVIKAKFLETALYWYHPKALITSILLPTSTSQAEAGPLLCFLKF